jgi:hypothetical protein
MVDIIGFSVTTDLSLFAMNDIILILSIGILLSEDPGIFKFVIAVVLFSLLIIQPLSMLPFGITVALLIAAVVTERILK